MSTLNEVITELQAAKVNIGTAITAKGGTANSGNGFSDYATDIGTITVPVAKKDVNFYDYDGTLVKGYTIAEAQALSALPSAPTHDLLTFQSWNCTLAQVNATVSAIDVGATYITTDGKSYFYIALTAFSGLVLPICLSKSDVSILSIDWGDGKTTTNSSSGIVTVTHTYSAIGNYVIKMWISSGTGTFGLSYFADYETSGFGGDEENYARTATLKQVLFGSNVTGINAFAFASCYSLETITLPNSITTIGSDAFYDCRSLVSVVIPNSITSIGQMAFSVCYSLMSVLIPMGVTSIGTSAFSACGRLASVLVPNRVVSIATNAFASCYSLKSVTLPDSITSIGSTAFYNCLACKNYKIRATTPPTLASTKAFYGIISSCKILVPSASLSAYKTATNWSTYASYMEGY